MYHISSLFPALKTKILFPKIKILASYLTLLFHDHICPHEWDGLEEKICKS